MLDDMEGDLEERLAIILEGSTTTRPSGVSICAISQAAAERLAAECMESYPDVAKAMGWTR